MAKYNIDLEEFCEMIFYEMEEIQDGKSGHVVEFKGGNKEKCAKKIAKKLVPFIEKQLEEKEN